MTPRASPSAGLPSRTSPRASRSSRRPARRSRPNRPTCSITHASRMRDGGQGTGVLAGPAVGATSFEYHRPREAGEVDDLLGRYGEEARVLAGGTDLIVQLRSRVERPAHVVDLV